MTGSDTEGGRDPQLRLGEEGVGLSLQPQRGGRTCILGGNDYGFAD